MKRQRTGGASNGGQSDQNQKVVSEFLMRLKKMYDGADASNPQTGRQTHSGLAQDDSVSHRSVPHSYTETNSIGIINYQQSARDKAATILRASQFK